jgi:hypothetical protein
MVDLYRGGEQALPTISFSPGSGWWFQDAQASAISVVTAQVMSQRMWCSEPATYQKYILSLQPQPLAQEWSVSLIGSTELRRAWPLLCPTDTSGGTTQALIGVRTGRKSLAGVTHGRGRARTGSAIPPRSYQWKLALTCPRYSEGRQAPSAPA